MIAEVIVDINNSTVDRVFDYTIPNEIVVEKGFRVEVPFGNRKIEGFVLNIKNESTLTNEKLKPISKVISSYAEILPEMFEIASFMKEKFNTKTVDALRLFIPSELRKGKVSVLKEDYLILNSESKFDIFNIKSEKQQKLLEYLLNKNIILQSEANKEYGSYAVKKLIENQLIIKKQLEKNRKPTSSFKIEQKNITHTEAQKEILNTIQCNNNKIYLLHGVTGSGKTEIYLSYIQDVINSGKTAIMLVPEISLTPQMFSNFYSRFGDDVAILHSGLSAGERYDEWRRLMEGKAKIVVGARSAIFAPLKNLGVIIIDEEHESSFMSESNPRYNTIDIAKFRQQYNQCTLLLGSATPSITDYYDAINGKIQLLELPKRVNGKEMPKMYVVDMLSEIRNGNNSPFSRHLLGFLDDVVLHKKQAMLFLNRRGYSSFQRCRNCGYVAKCEDCDVSLVYHKNEEKLKCHYCGKRYKALTKCPSCGSYDIKQGAIGTEKVVSELQKLYPKVNIFRMDNDTTQNKNAHLKILSDFASSKPGILVGTQMIAKGHDFKDVVLVGVIDADQSLFQSDYKANEKTFQLITQVAGRAGRQDQDGKVVIQTLMPNHFIFKFISNYDYLGFYKKEINLRNTTSFPPFTDIVRILFTSEKEDKVLENLRKINNEIKLLKENNLDCFVYHDIMKSPINRIQNKFRYQILMRIKCNHEEIIKEIYKIINMNYNKDVSCFVEINPTNLN